MFTISTRQLKQNPAEVIGQVLAASAPAAITAYGKPTGAVIAPQSPTLRPWVPGRVLMEAITPLPEDEVNAWQGDLAAGRQEAFGRDVWGDQ